MRVGEGGGREEENSSFWDVLLWQRKTDWCGYKRGERSSWKKYPPGFCSVQCQCIFQWKQKLPNHAPEKSRTNEHQDSINKLFDLIFCLISLEAWSRPHDAGNNIFLYWKCQIWSTFSPGSAHRTAFTYVIFQSIIITQSRYNFFAIIRFVERLCG